MAVVQRHLKKSKMRRFDAACALLLLSLLAASTCLASQEPEKKQEPIPAEQVKPEGTEGPKPLPASVDPKSFSLGPEDVLWIRVWREPELSGQVVIRPDGKINMPLIKEVAAAGLTPEQLGARVTEQLSKFINGPQVLVQVMAVRSKRYYISGEVMRPGAYPLAVPTTVFEAITLGGGFRDFANKKKITVVRGARRFRFNYNDVVRGKNLQQNIPLENGDQIIVP